MNHDACTCLSNGNYTALHGLGYRCSKNITTAAGSILNILTEAKYPLIGLIRILAIYYVHTTTTTAAAGC